MTPPAIPTNPSLPSTGSNRQGSAGIAPVEIIPGALNKDDLPPVHSTAKWKGDFSAQSSVGASTAVAMAADNGCFPDRSGSDFAGRGVPAWLVSTIIHALLLIALVLIRFDVGTRPSNALSARLAPLDTKVIEFDQLPPQITDLAVTLPTDGAEPPQFPALSTDAATASLMTSLALEVTPKSLAPLSGLSAQPPLRAQQLPKGGLYRRDTKSRAELGAKYGATPESENAVEAALKWLAIHQQRDGSWSFDLKQLPCNGQCRHTAADGNTARPATAATGLALLAFLGAGYTHHEGKYADEVRRGLYFLREQALPTNSGLDLQSGSMYGHGIAMMALSEAMAMTRYQGKTDSDLFSLTDGGSTFTMIAQHEGGGWRYVPGSPGDITVSGWAVLSLVSAQHGGVILRTQTLSHAERFIRSLSETGSYEFRYQPSEAKTKPTPTAIALCLLLYLGQSPEPTNFAMALEGLLKAGPQANDVYHNYYATLALHHARHRDWDAWHVPLRDHLVETQATTGHEAGSWHFPNVHGDIGGRLYTTAMAAMILEVYYRYLPLYRSDNEFRLDE